MSELSAIFQQYDEDFTKLKNQVYADHRLIKALQTHSRAQAQQLNTMIKRIKNIRTVRETLIILILLFYKRY